MMNLQALVSGTVGDVHDYDRQYWCPGNYPIAHRTATNKIMTIKPKERSVPPPINRLPNRHERRAAAKRNRRK